MNLQLEGKVALVTGGTRGIGREIALAFADEGVDLGICGRNIEQLSATAGEIGERGVRCVPVAADLFQAEDCDRVVEEVAGSFGRLDILVNNASTSVDSTPGKLEEITDDELMVRLTGKVLPSFRCTRTALPHLRRSGDGRIVFIGGLTAKSVSLSAAALIAGPANSALTNFAKQLSQRVASDGILVNVVHPGSTKTDRYPGRVRARAKQLNSSLEEAEASLAAETPLGRVVEPRDIAPLVVFLSSPLAGAITGQAIAVDAGASTAVSY